MARVIRDMQSPNTTSAGQTASVSLPIGMTYDQLFIHMEAATGGGSAALVAVNDWGDFIGEIRLMVDGDAKLTINAADLVKLNKFYGQPMVPGVLPIFLARPWMRTVGGEDATSYGTGANPDGSSSVSSFNIEMDLKDGITVQKMRVSALQSPGRPWGSHLSIRKFAHSQSLVGEAEITDLRRGAFAMFAMHIGTSAINDVELVINTREFLKMSKPVRSAHNAILKRTAQVGMTHIDIAGNRIGEAVPMQVQDFRLRADFTAAGAAPIYVESLDPR